MTRAERGERRLVRDINRLSRPREKSFKELFAEHKEEDKEIQGAIRNEAVNLRHELLDKDYGILPRLEGKVDHTNGTVNWLEKMIWLAMGGIGVLTALVLPLLWALISAGKI